MRSSRSTSPRRRPDALATLTRRELNRATLARQLLLARAALAPLELFDLPGAPRPPADAPAPIRLLPDYDNLVLAHHDRTRVIDDAHRPALTSKNGIVSATVLVDGRVAATWSVTRDRERAALSIRPLVTISKATRVAISEEADAALRFIEEDATSFSVAWPR